MSEPTDPRLQDPESEFYLEVTSLSPSVPRAGTPIARSHRWRRLWSLLLGGGAILIALAVLLNHVPPLPTALTGRSSTSTIVSRSSLTLVATSTPLGILGVVPSGCPPGNPVDTFSPAYTPGVGVAKLDIRLVGFSGSTATLHLGNSPRTKLGWEYKLLLVVAATVTQPITLQVEPVAGSAGLAWLSPGDIEQATVMLTFDPETAPTSSVDRWRSWPLYLYISSAGCYYLDLHYGGSQTPGTFFAAGQ
jgi:hypothetical protein